MKTRSFFAGVLLAGSCLLFAPSLMAQGTEAPENRRPQMPDGEMKALKGIQAAPDLSAKLTAADDFVKHYPKSLARKRAADGLLEQIARVADFKQKLPLIQSFMKIFTDDAEVKEAEPILIGTYIALNQFDDAFGAGGPFLSRNPDDIQDLINLAIAATEQAKQRNTKFARQGKEYGAAAIGMLEADRKPAAVDAANWDRFKKMLPQIYQEIAVIAIMQQNAADAQTNLDKAIKLNPSDPFNYALVANLTNDDYQRTAQTYKSMPDSKAKTDLLQKATELIDKAIDQYAHAVALSEGRPEYLRLHDQVLSDLTVYYKFRHNQTTEGLQQLIEKYKIPAKP